MYPERDAAADYMAAMWEGIRKATQGADQGDAAVAVAFGQAADAVVRALLYIGDQVGRLADVAEEVRK
jgi:ribosomal protein S11